MKKPPARELEAKIDNTNQLLEVLLPLMAWMMLAMELRHLATSNSTLIRTHRLIKKAINTNVIGIIIFTKVRRIFQSRTVFSRFCQLTAVKMRSHK